MNTHGSLAVIAAGLLWTSAGWMAEAFPSDLPPIGLAEARLLLGGGALLLWTGPRRTKAALATWPTRALMAAVGAMAAFQWGFFVSVAALGSGTAVLLTTAIGPAAAQSIAAARTGNRLGRRWGVAATLLGLAGLAAAADSAGAWTGVLAAVTSGIAYAVYAEITARTGRESGQERQSLVITGIALTGAGLLLTPVAFQSQWSVPTPRSLGVLLYLGLVATALAYGLFARGLHVLAAETALGLLVVQPLAALAGALLTHRPDGQTFDACPALLVAAAFIVRHAPWPLTPSRRRWSGGSTRDSSCPPSP